MPGITTAFAQGTNAARPAASSSNNGYYYLSTDVNGGTLYQSTGSSWVQLSGSVTPPTARITNSAAPTLSAGSYATLTFNTSDWDTNSMVNLGAHNTRLTVQTAGKYRLTGWLVFAFNATGVRGGRFLKNGSGSNAYMQVQAVTASTVETAITMTEELSLSVSDYIELQALQGSGGNLTLNWAEFSMSLVSSP